MHSTQRHASTGESVEVRAALAQFESLYPEKIALSLGRIEAALEGLGRPQDRLPPVIHVAGTNGKGSTCAFLWAMAEAAGLTVHVFTSPHLVRFNERIRLAGGLIKDSFLIDCLTRTREAVGDGQITHFEATTAAALLAFSEVPADLLILEVGLGGRFDASNVVDKKAVSVITPVDYDHKAFLGNDLAKIAWEKAGIMRANTPSVSAIQSQVCRAQIAETAADVGSDLTVLVQADVDKIPEDLGLIGEHQRYNAALAAKALEVWRGEALDIEVIRGGVSQVVWPARMQKLTLGPLTSPLTEAEVWLDGGHNPHAARAISKWLGEQSGETVLICAMMASKDAVGYFECFQGIASHVLTIPNAPGHSSHTPESLAEAARTAGLDATPMASLAQALEQVKDEGCGRVLICGSLYLAGDILARNNQTPE